MAIPSPSGSFAGSTCSPMVRGNGHCDAHTKCCKKATSCVPPSYPTGFHDLYKRVPQNGLIVSGCSILDVGSASLCET